MNRKCRGNNGLGFTTHVDVLYFWRRLASDGNSCKQSTYDDHTGGWCTQRWSGSSDFTRLASAWLSLSDNTKAIILLLIEDAEGVYDV